MQAHGAIERAVEDLEPAVRLHAQKEQFANLMREGCKLRGQRGKYACEVDEEAQPGDYKYSVKLDTCKEPLDPRIIVGTKK